MLVRREEEVWLICSQLSLWSAGFSTGSGSSQNQLLAGCFSEHFVLLCIGVKVDVDL